MMKLAHRPTVDIMAEKKETQRKDRRGKERWEQTVDSNESNFTSKTILGPSELKIENVPSFKDFL